MDEPSRHPQKKRLPSLTAALAGFAALILLAAVAIVPRILEMSPGGQASIGGPFSLVDQTGKSVTDADYRGRIMLIYFGYTFCPDVCPTTLGTLAQALDQLTPEQRRHVVPIFITVDPERDTVAVMAQYVGNFAPDLVGLTGRPDQIQAVTTEYRVYARKAESTGASYTMDHSSILYLMGKDGKFVAHFSGNASAKDIADGLRKAL